MACPSSFGGHRSGHAAHNPLDDGRQPCHAPDMTTTTTTNYDDVNAAGLPDPCPAGGDHDSYRDEDRNGRPVWVCEGCNEVLG